MTNEVKELYNQLWDLRAKQAESTIAERATIQAQIIELLAKIDKLEKES